MRRVALLAVLALAACSTSPRKASPPTTPLPPAVAPPVEDCPDGNCYAPGHAPVPRKEAPPAPFARPDGRGSGGTPLTFPPVESADPVAQHGPTHLSRARVVEEPPPAPEVWRDTPPSCESTDLTHLGDKVGKCQPSNEGSPLKGHQSTRCQRAEEPWYCRNAFALVVLGLIVVVCLAVAIFSVVRTFQGRS